MTQGTDGRGAQKYARIAGVLLVLSFIGGGFGEAYMPSRLIVSGDAGATAQNLKSLDFLFRLGFVAYLVEAVCDISLALIFYVLLRPVHRQWALLAAFFGLVSTAVFAAAELFYFAPSLILGGAGYLKTFSPDQLNTLALLSLRLYGLGAAIFSAFYGTAWVVRGYLIFRSGYFPRFLGVLMTLAGVAFVVRNVAVVLAPKVASGGLLLVMVPGLLALAVWLLVKGVDVPNWEAKAAVP